MTDPRTEKTRDYRRNGFTRGPHCPTCGATSIQSHDLTKHADLIAAAFVMPTHKPRWSVA